MKEIHLTDKLSLLVTFGIIVPVGILGCYFDSFLKNNFFEDTNKRMLYGFQRLKSDQETISQELQEGISFVQSDEHFLASTHLLNNYQDKNKYNAELLDEEKKRIALQLLNRVKLSLNHFIVLYDKDEELVAFVEQRKEGYQLHFISYEEGQPILYSRQENQQIYVKHAVPETLPVDFYHHAYYSDAVAQKGTITYHIHDRQIVTTSHLSIFDELSNNFLMHLEMSHLFDDAYFRNLSQNLDLVIKYSTDEKNIINAHSLFEINDVKELPITQTEKAYFSTAKIITLDGNFFYRVQLNKEKLLSALSKNRRQFLVLIIIVSSCVLISLRLFFSKTLMNPLELIMEQIRKIEMQDYTQSTLVETGDELEVISININHLAVTIHEREAALLESQKKLEYLSHHDPLTNLPNRRLFLLRLEQAIKQAQQDNTEFAVLFLDIDGFKQVNDTFGHDVGDQFLIEISLRLDATLRESATLARIGGNEFNILIEDIENINDVGLAAEKLLADFKLPFTCVEHELSTTASIGIALYPHDGVDTVSLIKHADMAMYQSKDEGRNGYRFFSAELATDVRKRIERLNALKKALLNLSEFYLLYQPKISLLTGKVESMEALVRWQSPTLGFMRPDQFIRLAEETNLIIPLGEWITEQAFRDFIALKEKGCPLKKVSINISSVQLLNSDMLKTVTKAIRHTGILPNNVELEITESYIATNEKKAIQMLQHFREMNIELAIDDFGTGYSSMSYLKKLPVTRLKIDKSFIDDLSTSEESRAIIQAIIALAKTFKLAVTAEGVENEEQFKFLKKAGCDEVQGFLYAKPLGVEEFKIFAQSFNISQAMNV
ncbi:MAG: EAL domain-containing protein [Candidatus Electrothrix sp. AR3]|nr:EAL domain-containing protein [Candidatus Electrothrix sp. AR3]